MQQVNCNAANYYNCMPHMQIFHAIQMLSFTHKKCLFVFSRNVSLIFCAEIVSGIDILIHLPRVIVSTISALQVLNANLTARILKLM